MSACGHFRSLDFMLYCEKMRFTHFFTIQHKPGCREAARLPSKRRLWESDVLSGAFLSEFFFLMQFLQPLLRYTRNAYGSSYRLVQVPEHKSGGDDQEPDPKLDGTRDQRGLDVE